MGKTGYNNLREDELLVHAKKLVVKERNLLVNRPKLATIVQDEDEPFYKFETRLKPIARTGKFHQKCVKCNVEVDFTEQMVRDHLIRGLADLEIKKKSSRTGVERVYTWESSIFCGNRGAWETEYQ